MYTPLQLIPPLPANAYDPSPYVTSLSFDIYTDLLHLGTSSGSVHSFASPLELSRYTSYPAHGAKGFGSYSTTRPGLGAGEVKELAITDGEVRALTEGGIGGRKRTGLPIWSAT